nr:hypothetical protein [uncultured Sphingomonas sp.]
MTGAIERMKRHRWGWGIAAAALVGVILRVAMGRGGLWLDEAWSVVMAHDAGGPIGVIAGIHHDNNHPLNSWWLQIVGPAAPPLLARGLSIICSTLTIFVAARVAGRRSNLAGVMAAFMFAVSPMLVLLGSEARGYAPMLLALMWMIDRLDHDADAPSLTQGAMIFAAAMGTLGHFVMLPSLFLLAAWQALAAPGRWASRVQFAAARLGPSIAYSMMVVVIVIGLAWSVQGGLTIGSATPFSWGRFALGLADAVHFSIGVGPWALLLVPLLLMIAPPAQRRDLALWGCLGLGLPIAAALFHPANSHIARYYLPSVAALLWLLAIRAGSVRRLRGLAVAAVGLLVAASLATDAQLIRARRGEPDRPVALIMEQRPAGARLLLASERLSAPVKVAIWQKNADLAVTGPACAPADYLLVDLEEGAAAPVLIHCGQRWTLADWRPSPYRGGVGWALYRQSGLHA